MVSIILPDFKTLVGGLAIVGTLGSTFKTVYSVYLGKHLVCAISLILEIVGKWGMFCYFIGI